MLTLIETHEAILSSYSWSPRAYCHRVSLLFGYAIYFNSTAVACVLLLLLLLLI